jgi:hypothetical protein
MVGLGVLLVRKGPDGETFAIRTPSLRRLFGREGVLPIVDRLSREEPTDEKRIESWHARLEGGGFALFSTSDESRALDRCVAVAGAPIAGSDRLPDELERIRERRGISDIMRVPPSVQQPDHLTAWLREGLMPRGRQERVFVQHDLTASAAALLPDFEEGVRRFARTGDRQVTVWFRLCPDALYTTLLHHPELVGADATAKGDTATPIILGPWPTEAVRARLYERRHEPTREEARVVMEHTAGWPMLLDAFDTLLTKGRRPGDVVSGWQERLAGSDFASKVVAAMALQSGGVLFSVFDRIVDSDGLFVEEAGEWLESQGFADREGRAALATLRAMHFVSVESGEGALVSPDPILARLWRTTSAAAVTTLP